MVEASEGQTAGAAGSDEAELMAVAAECGADGMAVIDVADIIFRPEFRALCEANRCGNYDRNWRCPPKAGEIGDLIDGLKKRTRAMVFNHVARLKNAYDFVGMTKGGLSFAAVCQRIVEKRPAGFSESVVLGAGPCKVCERCGLLDGEPCRHPDLAVTSLEACGVDVSQLAKLSSLKYNAGPGTVTYFGAVFI
ncbi:MAG: DUF2284 domain-containing protein [Deltaproteobacteria bacterium]|jgi:predicted metal-binding protein|nr:DUF2284 domain-containing protein [Deltaproteobacteria bacterium]